MNTKYWVNINSKLVDQGQAHISVFDRGFLFGDSVYEVTRVYNGVPLFFEDHFERLEFSASRIYMKLPLEIEQLKEEVLKTLSSSDLKEAYIRIIVTRGEGEIGMDTGLANSPNTIIICKKLNTHPKSYYEDGVKLTLSEVLRNAPRAMDPNIKSGNYLNNVLAYRKASISDAHESIMLNASGQVTECTTSNIWMVKGEQIFTPPIEAGLLKGITREKILSLNGIDNLEIKEEHFSFDELTLADEVFITSSTREIMPATSIDEISIGSGSVGPITKKLMTEYKNQVKDYIRKNR